MNARIALVTLEYPPDVGGVAKYLYGLVEASHGNMEALTQNKERFFQTLWPRWLPMVALMRSLPVRGYGHALVSHVLPVGTAAWMAKKSGGLPYSVIIHGLDLRCAKKTFAKRWLARRVLRAAANVIANSDAVAKDIRAFDARLDPVVLSPAIFPHAFPSRGEARRLLSLCEGDRLVLAVTRLVPRKGIDRLIAAADRPWRLVVIGDGEDRARLELLAASKREQVTFLGNVADGERDRWYAAADVFAMPVRDDGDDVEGFGIVFLEAALAGLPVIAGRSGGAPEAVQDGVTGLLVDPHRTEEVSAAIHRLLDDGALRKRLGENGRIRVLRDFQWEGRWQRLVAHLLPMASSPPVSVIIPCHNHAEELGSCLASLERQSVKPHEVIVVDDGSDCPVRVDANAYPFPVTLVRLEKNGGAPAARNEGFRRSNGVSVLFLDADGILVPDALERLHAALVTHPEAAFAYSAFDYGWKRFASRPFDVRALQQCNFIHTSALIRREWFSGFDESLKKFQDWDLWLTMTERGGNGAYVPDRLMRFATRRGGMSRWLPSFVHRLSWPIFGWMPEEIRRYREWEGIIRKKHGI